MSQDKPSFNLVDEPWIGARTLSGQQVELSLRELFHRSRELARLANELPTQDFAIFRVLLAVLRRTVAMHQSYYGDPIDVWQSLWQDDELLAPDIDEYLSMWHHAFDLFDGENPFMQVAGLEAANGSVSEVKKLIAHQPDGEPLFSMLANQGLESLTYAEAARWLVHVHAYDTSGIKTGVKNDPDVKGGKSYPIGTGWAGRLGGLFLEGNNLAESLLLNLVLYSPSDQDALYDFEGDLPAWERGPYRPGSSGRLPDGPSDLGTWQTRRVRLIAEGGLVKNLVLSNGDKVDSHNQLTREHMTSWYRSKNQEKKLGISPVYFPSSHVIGKSLWRGLNSVLPEGGDGDDDRFKTAELLKWAGRLASEDAEYALDPAYPLCIHAVGFAYGVQSSVVSEMIDDSLVLSPFLLSPQGQELAGVVKKCLSATDAAVSSLGFLAENLRLAAGDGGDVAKAAAEKARTEAYFELDAAFRTWLASLGPQSLSVIGQVREEWHSTAFTILRGIGSQLVRDADVKALTGRPAKKGAHWLSAAGAEASFVSQLKKHLEYSQQARTNQEGSKQNGGA